MNRLLIVEDEATLRASVARGLARLPDVEVTAVGTIADALAAIDLNPPDLILSDIDLPDRSGIELLGEIANRGIRCSIIFVSAYLRAYGAQIPPNAGVEVLEKPVPLETLRDVVLRRLRVSSEDAPFAVVDYIQLACMGHRSVLIEFRTDRRIGIISVKNGVLWTAEDLLGSGTPAFHRLAFRRDGRVTCSTLRENPGPRTIDESWESLLLEAARLLDEMGKHSPSQEEGEELQLAPPLLTPVPSERSFPAVSERSLSVKSEQPSTTVSESSIPAVESPGSSFALIWDRGLHALLAHRYEEALQAFLEAREICPEDRKVQANIARLEAMGYRVNAQKDPT